jgi:hypothetical protein
MDIKKVILFAGAFALIVYLATDPIYQSTYPELWSANLKYILAVNAFIGTVFVQWLAR